MTPPWFRRAGAPDTPTMKGNAIGQEGRASSTRFFFHCVELGLGRVAFLDDPFESLDEVVDARSRGLGHTLANDVVDLARRLALQQQLGVIFFQANHSAPSLPNQ